MFRDLFVIHFPALVSRFASFWERDKSSNNDEIRAS